MKNVPYRQFCVFAFLLEPSRIIVYWCVTFVGIWFVSNCNSGNLMLARNIVDTRCLLAMVMWLMLALPFFPFFLGIFYLKLMPFKYRTKHMICILHKPASMFTSFQAKAKILFWCTLLNTFWFAQLICDYFGVFWNNLYIWLYFTTFCSALDVYSNPFFFFIWFLALLLYIQFLHHLFISFGGYFFELFILFFFLIDL